MARRTAAEVEILRTQIVDETLRQFADHGVEGTNVSHIAKAVGISKQALMYHFKTKEALSEAIRERVKRSLDEFLPHMVAAFTADDAALDDVLEELVTHMSANQDLARFMLRVVSTTPSHVPTSGDSIASLLLEYLRRGQAEGTLRQDFNPEDALFVMGLMFLACQAGSSHRGPGQAQVPDRTLQKRRNRELIRVAKAALLPS